MSKFVRDLKKKVIETIFYIKKHPILSTILLIVFAFMLYRYVCFYIEVNGLESASYLIDNKEEVKEVKKVKNEEYVSTWGAFGDFIGGTLNPLLTFISVIFLASTILQNKRALKINSKELKLSRKANQISSKAQESIQVTQSLQQFDSIFFSLLNQLNTYSLQLTKIRTNEDNNILIEIYNSVFKEYKNGIISPDIYQRRKLILGNNEINQYFIFLYQILKITRDSLEGNNSLGEETPLLKKKYGNIIRASISAELLQLLVINILDKFSDYRDLIEDFNLLEHMSFKLLSGDGRLNLPLLANIYMFKKTAFNKSIYYKNLESNSLLNFYLKVNKVDTNEKFIKKILNEYEGVKIYISLTRTYYNGDICKYRCIDEKYTLCFKDGNVTVQKLHNSRPSIFYVSIIEEGVALKIDNTDLVINPNKVWKVESRYKDLQFHKVSFS